MIRIADIDRATLPEQIQKRLERFEERKADYLATQQQYQDVVQETNRLEQAAIAMDAEAQKANASWKGMAKSLRADQRKINAEIERSVKARQDADSFRLTAEIRQDLHGELVVQMAKARWDVVKMVEPINHAYRTWRQEAILATEGFLDNLAELYALFAEGFAAEINQMEGVEKIATLTTGDRQSRENTYQHAFGRLLVAKLPAGSPGFGLVSAPPPVTGEVLVSSLIAMKRLVANNGKIPTEGGNGAAWKNVPGLQQVG